MHDLGCNPLRWVHYNIDIDFKSQASKLQRSTVKSFHCNWVSQWTWPDVTLSKTRPSRLDHFLSHTFDTLLAHSMNDIKPIDQLKATITELTSTNQTLLAKRRDLQLANTQLTDEVKRISTQRDTFRDKFAKARRDLVDVRNELDILKMQYEDLQNSRSRVSEILLRVSSS